jgi:hypothetical protein
MSATSHPGAINCRSINASVGRDFAELFQSGSETLDNFVSKNVGIWEMAFMASVPVA